MSIPRRYYVYGALGGAGLVAILMRRRPAGLPSFATGDRATRADPDPQGILPPRPKDLAVLPILRATLAETLKRP